MSSKVNNYSIIRYSIYGLLIGIIFSMLIMIHVAYRYFGEFSIFKAMEYLSSNKLEWVFYFIVIVVFVLGAYFIGLYFNIQINKLQDKLQEEVNKNQSVYEFTERLRQGSIFDKEIDLPNDKLSKSLMNLRNELQKKGKDEKQRKQEEYQRHWITEGLASFGSVLRAVDSNLEELSYAVVSELAKYLKAQIVGIFIINDTDEENKFIEQTGAFAYERKKFADKKLEWGEGLVGGCILEKKTVFVQDVTDNYVKVTSGLGKANPRCILIVPLIFNEIVYGAIEIASLKVLEAYETEFVEKLGESIASTISSLKINMRTAILLKDSQKGQEIMKRQEIEMRNSMKELRQTQIEAAKQSDEFVSFTNSVNHTMIRAEYSIDGTLTYANTKFLTKLGYSSNKEVEGHNISMFISEKDRDWFDELWTRITKGGEHFEGDMKHVSKAGKDMWTMATYVSVRDHEGNPSKILFLGIDMTDAKKQSLDYTGQIEALDRSMIKAEFTPGGKIIGFNEKFKEALFYESLELQDKTIFDFISPAEVNEFSIIWKNILAGVPFERRMRMVTRTSEDRWLHGTFYVVSDIDGGISKVVYISYDITNQIRIEAKNKEQNEKLRIQEERLQQSQGELSRKLREAREETRVQFKEIEIVKMLHEKTLEGMLDAVVTLNQDDIVTFFNKAAEDLWSIDRKEVLKQHVSVLLPEEYGEKGDNYLGSMLHYGSSVLLNTRNEVFIVDKFGEQIPLLVSLSEAQLGKRYTLTALIQKIEVELF